VRDGYSREVAPVEWRERSSILLKAILVILILTAFVVTRYRDRDERRDARLNNPKQQASPSPIPTLEAPQEAVVSEPAGRPPDPTEASGKLDPNDPVTFSEQTPFVEITKEQYENARALYFPAWDDNALHIALSKIANGLKSTKTFLPGGTHFTPCWGEEPDNEIAPMDVRDGYGDLCLLVKLRDERYGIIPENEYEPYHRYRAEASRALGSEVRVAIDRAVKVASEGNPQSRTPKAVSTISDIATRPADSSLASSPSPSGPIIRPDGSLGNTRGLLSETQEIYNRGDPRMTVTYLYERGVAPQGKMWNVTRPEYTEAARRAKLSGDVILSLVIDTDGDPQDVKVIKSLGMGLDENAINVVRTWKFMAGRDGKNQKVSVIAIIKIPFVPTPSR
jgi:TonB family protein